MLKDAETRRAAEDVAKTLRRLGNAERLGTEVFARKCAEAVYEVIAKDRDGRTVCPICSDELRLEEGPQSATTIHHGSEGVVLPFLCESCRRMITG